MKPTWLLGALLLGFLPAQNVHACMGAFPSESLAKKGRNIVVGTVLSTKFVERPTNAAVVGVASTNSRSLSQPEMLAKVEVQEILKGKAPGVVTAVSPCSFPLKIGERVVVATYDGRRVVFPSHMYEASFRSVYGDER